MNKESPSAVTYLLIITVPASCSEKTPIGLHSFFVPKNMMYRGACVNYSVEIQPAKSGLIKNDVTGKQELNILSHTQRPLNRHTTVAQPIY
jgi:hypothetical protein